jgi:hypothetical protein
MLNYPYKPTLEANQNQVTYDIIEMTLREFCNVLLDHQYTFEEIREMKPQQIQDALDDINTGKRKSWTQVKAEEKAARDAARARK